MELGLLYYGARFYVSGLGRFASADTIVPDPADPQSYNRYSYVLNRTLNFTDPTGHMETPFTEGGGGDGEEAVDDPLPGLRNTSDVQYDLTDWLVEEMVNNVQGSDMLEIQEMMAGNRFRYCPMWRNRMWMV